MIQASRVETGADLEHEDARTKEFLRRDLRRRLADRAPSQAPAAGAVLDLLTHAAQAIDAARELAADAGFDVTAQVIQRCGVFAASAIDTLTQPLHVAVSGVLQPPVKSVPVPKGGGR